MLSDFSMINGKHIQNSRIFHTLQENKISHCQFLLNQSFSGKNVLSRLWCFADFVQLHEQSESKLYDCGELQPRLRKEDAASKQNTQRDSPGIALRIAEQYRGLFFCRNGG